MFVKKLTLLLFFGIFSLLIISCKDDDNPASSSNKLIANWSLLKISFVSGTLSYEITVQDLGYNMILKIKSDNTYQILIDGEIDEEGTWGLSGSKLTFTTSEGDTQAMDFTVDSNKLILSFTTEEEPPVGPPQPPSKILKYLDQGTITMEFNKVN